MLLRLFRDAPLIVKMLLPPMLCIAGAIGVCSIAYFGIAQTNGMLSHIATVLAPKSSLIARLDATLSSVHTRAFRAMIWQNAGVPEERIEKLTKEIARDLDGLVRQPQAIIERFPAADAEKERLSALTEGIKGYRKDLLDTLDLISDPATAAGYIARSDASFEKLKGTIESIAEEADNESLMMIAHADRSSSETVARFLVVLGAFTVLALVSLPFLVRLITRPLRAMTGAMSALAAGNAEVEILYHDRRDEIGAMAAAIQIFKENKLTADRLAAEQREEQARRERRQQAIEGTIAAFDRSARSLFEALAASSTEMRATAESMAGTAVSTSRDAAAVAAATGEASANMQSVASASEEMTATIAEISRQVTQSSAIAGQAVEEAGRANATMQGLASAAQKIGEVVVLIQDIAAQTNLLALNATIEAARAGEAGKGFAVVASEVKTLAGQTAKATEEIAAQIAAIQAESRGAVTAIEGINGTIARMSEIATGIASAIEEQAATAQEITRNTQEAAGGTEQVNHSIAGVTQAAEGTGAAASQVLAAADELGRQAETLRGEVDRFLADVRAA